MALSNVEFLNFAGRQISKPFSGDALALQPFLNSVALIKTIATDAHKEIFKCFVPSKLEGRALENVPDDVADVDAIVTALKTNIKPDSSDVIAGRLQTLKANQNNLAEYAKQAEDLADALQRALVIEGLPLAKAKEMTVKETIKLCCANARSDQVKLILEAKDKEFEQPKEVIARFIVQSAKDKEEKQMLAYKVHSQNQMRRGRNNFQTHNRQSYSSGNRSYFQNYGNNNYGNNRGNFNNPRGYKGRGRGNNVRGNNSYYRRNSNFNGQQNRFLRVLTEAIAPPPGNQAPGNQAGNSNGAQQPTYRLPF